MTDTPAWFDAEVYASPEQQITIQERTALILLDMLDASGRLTVVLEDGTNAHYNRRGLHRGLERTRRTRRRLGLPPLDRYGQT